MGIPRRNHLLLFDVVTEQRRDEECAPSLHGGGQTAAAAAAAEGASVWRESPLSAKAVHARGVVRTRRRRPSEGEREGGRTRSWKRAERDSLTERLRLSE